jgi:hypothetical protein
MVQVTVKTRKIKQKLTFFGCFGLLSHQKIPYGAKAIPLRVDIKLLGLYDQSMLNMALIKNRRVNEVSFFHLFILALGLGLYWSEGAEPPPSKEKIAYWQKSAENGDSNSMVMMGIIYRDGWGIKKESEKAASWFNRAAVKGNGTAAMQLSKMLMSGQGIEKHSVLAYMWARIARVKEMRESEEILAELDKKLTDVQRGRAIYLMHILLQHYPEIMVVKGTDPLV